MPAYSSGSDLILTSNSGHTKGKIYLGEDTTTAPYIDELNGGVLHMTELQTVLLSGANPMDAVGQLIAGGAGGVLTKVAENTAAVKKYLSETGTGAAGQAPVFEQVSLADVSAPAADFAMNAHKITGVLDPTAAQDAATMTYVKAIGSQHYASCAGAKNALTGDLTPAITAYTAGMVVMIKSTVATNDEATTIALNSLAVKPVVTKAAGAACSGGEVVDGSYYILAYDGTSFVILA